MSNTKQLRSHCTVCGRAREPDERFSARGRCYDCGLGRMVRNADELAAHAGPYFVAWRRACAAAFGLVIMDDRTRGD